MSKITSLLADKRKRVKLYLDGKLALRLEAGVAAQQRLHTGQELSTDQMEALKGADHHQRCLDTANRYLSYRPRSESELRKQLQRHGFDSGSIDSVIARLKRQGLIDDTAFAHFWQENRASFRPRSRSLTMLELKRKGVDGEVIEEALASTDDGDSAYRAALSKASRLPLTDYPLFRRRLGDFLRRRGFNYEIITDVVERVWRESMEAAPDSLGGLTSSVTRD